MSLVGPQVKREFRLDNERYGQVLAAFSLAYAFFQVPAGYLADRGDVRKTYAGAVAFWSLAGMATAVAPSLWALLALRAVLGLGESFNWPCALRVTGRVLPPGDRGLGNGIFNSGAAVGAVVTPLVVPLLAARFGWRAAFVAVGALGFGWVALWLALTWGRCGAAIAGNDGKTDEVGELPALRSGLSRPAAVAFGVLAALAGSLAPGGLAVRPGGDLVGGGDADDRAAGHRAGLADELARGGGLGRGARRARPEAAVLGHGGRLDLGQRLLALPRQLAADLPPRRPRPGRDRRVGRPGRGRTAVGGQGRAAQTWPSRA